MYRYVDAVAVRGLVDELRAAADELERAGRAVSATAAVLVVGVQRRIAEAAEWAQLTAVDVHRRIALLTPPQLSLPPARLEPRPSGHDSWYRRLVPAYLRSGDAAARFIIAGLAPARTSDGDHPLLRAAPAWLAHRVRLGAVRDAWQRQEAELTALAASGRLTADELRQRRRERGHDDVLLARSGRLSAHEVYAILSALPADEREVAMQDLGTWAADLDRRGLSSVERGLLRGALAAVRRCHLDVPASGGAVGRPDDDPDAVEALAFPRAPEPLEWSSAALGGLVLGPLAPEGYDEPPEVRTVRDRAGRAGDVLAGAAGGPAGAVRSAVHIAHDAADDDWAEVAWGVAGAVPLTRAVPDRVAVERSTVERVERLRTGALGLRGDGEARAEEGRDGPEPTGRVVDVASCLTPPHASPEAASGGLEDHPAGLQPPSQQGTEGGRGGEHARPVG